VSVRLAVDTSSEYLAVALWGEDGVQFERTEHVGRAHAARLPHAFDEALRDAGVPRDALSSVTVGVGPGSYTGIRVGIAAARGVAFALGLPLHGACSLAMVAAHAGPQSGPVRVLRDARRGRVYAAEFVWLDGRLNVTTPAFKAERDALSENVSDACMLEDTPPSALWAARPDALHTEPAPNYLE
jgi:tRNA threonylcarbamoyl adenosine modification protein YeaZ